LLKELKKNLLTGAGAGAGAGAPASPPGSATMKMTRGNLNESGLKGLEDLQSLHKHDYWIETLKERD
jgi:hypothetical protein